MSTCYDYEYISITMELRSWESQASHKADGCFELQRAHDEIQIAGYTIINNFLDNDLVKIYKEDIESRFRDDRLSSSSAIRGDQMIVNNFHH